jgi:hypothetical protein
MRKKGFIVVMACAVLLAAAAFLQASGKSRYKVLSGPQDFYYGHISYTEVKADGNDPVVLREGAGAPEAAVLNLPLGPGDTIRTTADRRCEIQFDSGTIIRLDVATELRLETILARSLSTPRQLSNLTLNKGRISVMYKQYSSGEMFQVLTPNAAVMMKHNTVAFIRLTADGATDAQVRYGKASVLFGPDENSLKKEAVEKMGRLIVNGDNQAQHATYIAGSDFELWNDEINARFDELHKGQSALPKPVQKLPKAVFDFAQEFGNLYGEWLWDSLYGYVWRPFLNNGTYPWGNWQPYFYGRWSYAGGQMYWVPEEPWGWIPYHLGIWQWDKKLGWVWLPGSLFAPAWVDWEFFFGYCGWRPYSLFDFLDGFSTDFSFFDGGWYYALSGPTTGPYAGARPPLTAIRRNQLKQPGAPSFSLPKELKGVSARVLTAYKSGDPRVLDSMKRVSSQTVFVAKVSLNGPNIRDKALTWENVPKIGVPAVKNGPGAFLRPSDPGREAARVFRNNEFRMNGAVSNPKAGPGAAGPKADRTNAGKSVPSPASPSRQDAAGHRTGGAMVSGAAVFAPSAGGRRFLDWNPDVRVARELGVHIEYSSGMNEVRCPELKITSADRERGSGYVPNLTPGGVSYVPSASAIGSSSGAPASSSSPGNAGHAANREGSGKGGGGKIKN